MSNRNHPDQYPDSAAYRTSFEEWMSPHNNTLPEHLTAGQVASIGFVPVAVHDPGQTTGEEWAEYVWEVLDDETRVRLLDHLAEVMADIFEGLPDYQVNAEEWALNNFEDELADATAAGWVLR